MLSLRLKRAEAALCVDKDDVCVTANIRGRK
jgi:hypothetical protein